MKWMGYCRMGTELYERGGHGYRRPCGWKRLALQLDGKYADDDWLGPQNGRRSAGGRGSVSGEWAVAYFGTSRETAEEIVEGGFTRRHCQSRLSLILNTDPEIAAAFSTPWTHQGQRYQLLLQARVAPNAAAFRGKPGRERVCIRTSALHQIRPYGVCIRPC